MNKPRRRTKKITLSVISIILLTLLAIFLIRLVSPRHLDDLSPEIPCDENLIKKSDILFIIPNFNNKSIADNSSWCTQLLAYNKTLALHGFQHTYQEFKTDRDEEYFKEAEAIFTSCFNQTVVMFKPSQLEISKNNLATAKQRYKTVYTPLNNLFHKAHHCNDTGSLPNWFHELF